MMRWSPIGGNLVPNAGLILFGFFPFEAETLFPPSLSIVRTKSVARTRVRAGDRGALARLLPRL